MKDKILVLNGESYSKALGKYDLPKLGTIVYDEQEFINNPTAFSMVMFTGGSDVHPSVYGDTSPLGYCSSNIGRDVQERIIYDVAMQHHIKMTGICRGSQFLNVMCGGRMMHHITNHGSCGGHLMYTSKFKKPIPVNTLHHQMSILAPSGVLLGWTNQVSTKYIGKNDEEESWQGPETEVFAYPENNICAVQYHPEMLAEDSSGYLFYYYMIKYMLHHSMKQFMDEYTQAKKETYACSM